jgi:hypothetical protein
MKRAREEESANPNTRRKTLPYEELLEKAFLSIINYVDGMEMIALTRTCKRLYCIVYVNFKKIIPFYHSKRRLKAQITPITNEVKREGEKPVALTAMTSISISQSDTMAVQFTTNALFHLENLPISFQIKCNDTLVTMNDMRVEVRKDKADGFRKLNTGKEDLFISVNSAASPVWREGDGHKVTRNIFSETLLLETGAGYN